MNLNRAVAGLAVAGLVTAAAGGLWAAPRQAVPRAGAGGALGIPKGPGLPLAQLGLTDDQRQQIAALVRQNRTAARPLMQRARAARASLRAAMAAEPVDDSLIRAKSAEAAAIEADLAIAQAHLRADVFALLTPEQQAKARELRNRRPDRAPQAPGI
jgi:periplasmic protein CpxP/Spy